MSLLSLVLLIVIPLSLLALGLLVYFNNPKSLTNKLFFLMALTSAGAAVGSMAAQLTTSSEVLFFWVKFTMFFASVVTPLMFLFILVYPKDKYPLKKSWIFAESIVALVLTVGVVKNYLFTSALFTNNSISVAPGPLIILFVLSLLFHFIAIAIKLYQRINISKGKEKEQFKYLAFGLIVTLILISIFNVFFVVVLNNTSFLSFGMASFIVFEGSIVYAITKHRLLDMRFVVARSVAYVLLVSLLSIFYTSAVFLISQFLFKGDVTGIEAFIYAVLALFIAFTFQPLKLLLERMTDKVFFKSRYDSNELLSVLTKILATTLNLHDITKKTLHELLKTMHVSRGIFLIFEGENLYHPISDGFSHDKEYKPEDIKWFCDFKRVLIFEEESNEHIKQKMRDLDVSVVMPLHVGDKHHGVLMLGEKQSGDIYSNQDIQVLEIFGPEVSVAIQNAKSYEEISRFNINLKQEVHKATEELQMANSQLKELDKLKDDFVSIASHELRTPMTAIRSYAWMALYRSDVPLSDRMKKYLERTVVSTERLINLVNDMLNISRIEAGSIEINPQVFDLKKLVSDVFEEVAIKASEKKITLKLEEGSVPKVFADPDKVHQVLLNLIGNSLKFTLPEGQITVSFFPDGEKVETSVKDNGVGIDKDNLSSLFKKFGRLDNSYVAAATSGGTGLGLFICKKLVELMKGSIKATSEGLGKGTTFTFNLPIATKEMIDNSEKYKIKAHGEVKGLEPVAI